jgi:hypothetical protein
VQIFDQDQCFNSLQRLAEPDIVHIRYAMPAFKSCGELALDWLLEPGEAPPAVDRPVTQASVLGLNSFFSVDL